MKKLYILFFAICLTAATKAQDLHFSQFFEAPLYRNPALAGLVDGDIRVQTVYRSQWNSVANAYQTGSLNVEYKLPVMGDDYLTAAVQVYYDKAGTANMNSTHILPALNYHKSISSVRTAYLSFGFMGGVVQRSIDRSKITTSAGYGGGGDGEANLQPQMRYLDGSAGLSFNTSLGAEEQGVLVLGAAMHHFNKPKSSFYNNEAVIVSPKWVYSADLKWNISEYNFLTIYNDHVRQNTYTETMSGMLYGIKIGPYSDEPDYILKGGAFMRWGDAVIPTLQLDYRPFSISLSYDVNISKLSTFSKGQGGYELGLKYVGFTKRENSSLNAVRCPIF
jgi:type IX secretion system PorP/SprF family membrane protein